MRPRQPSARKLDQMVADWNAANAVGAPVIFTRDSGSEFATTTRSKAEVLSGHTAVIWLVGVTGCYLLDRVRPA